LKDAIEGIAGQVLSKSKKDTGWSKKNFGRCWPVSFDQKSISR